MPNMSAKAVDITDPEEMLRRISYRNRRIVTRAREQADPALYAHNLASRNRSDLRRLAVLMGVELRDYES